MGKKFGVLSEFVLAIQEYFDLSYNCPFRLAIQIFFGVSVPHLALGMLLFCALNLNIGFHFQAYRGSLYKSLNLFHVLRGICNTNI